MEPIRPIAPSVSELPAVEKILREQDRQRDRQQQKQEQRRERKRPEEPPEDDGRPHIDISV